MSVQVKICGINHPDAATAALKGGARFIGLVFFERSPRHVAPPLAAELARMIPTGVRSSSDAARIVLIARAYSS